MFVPIIDNWLSVCGTSRSGILVGAVRTVLSAAEEQHGPALRFGPKIAIPKARSGLSDKEFLGFELDCDTVERNLCPADIEIRRTDMIFSHQETLRDRLFFHPHLV